jgi:hypothetical protein
MDSEKFPGWPSPRTCLVDETHLSPSFSSKSPASLPSASFQPQLCSHLTSFLNLYCGSIIIAASLKNKNRCWVVYSVHDNCYRKSISAFYELLKIVQIWCSLALQMGSSKLAHRWKPTLQTYCHFSLLQTCSLLYAFNPNSHNLRCFVQLYPSSGCSLDSFLQLKLGNPYLSFILHLTEGFFSGPVVPREHRWQSQGKKCESPIPLDSVAVLSVLN